MSERLFKFLLSELALVRVTCTRKNCNWTVEVPMENLARVAHSKCPMCDGMFDVDQLHSNPFSEFARAVEQLNKLSHRVTVEFVLPDQSPTA